MTSENGGEQHPLAPVIPLFGGAAVAVPAGSSTRPVQPGDPTWHATWIEDQARRSTPRTSMHPVFGGGRSAADDAPRAAPAHDERVTDADDAERDLLRKLRTRSLSLREARAVLAGHELDADVLEELMERFVSLGYLDDTALAEQLIHTSTSRKAQGRQAVAQTLSRRGIPREVLEEALAALPDDESERALDFARGKARALSGLDPDVALRRLAGQLARRGYGSISLTVARQALDETDRPHRGVRFE